MTSSDVNRIGSVAVSPDSKWVAFAKQDRTLRSHVYIAPIGGGEERHVSDDRLLYSESNAVWTADGRYLVFTSAEGFSNGIATQGGIGTTMGLWVLSLRDQERDPMNRDIDNEAQGAGGRSGRAPGERSWPAGRRLAAPRAAGRPDRLERPRASRAAPHGAGHDARRLTPAPGRARRRVDRLDGRRRRRRGGAVGDAGHGHRRSSTSKAAS